VGEKESTVVCNLCLIFDPEYAGSTFLQCARKLVPDYTAGFYKIRRGADRSLAFPVFLFAAQPKEFFLNGLKELEQRSHKCVELRGECAE
jgi:hypothetical protein